MNDFSSTIVLDLGSHNIRAGLLNDILPRFIIPSVFPSNSQKFSIEDDIPLNCTPDFAISNGEVLNRERMTYIFASIFDHLFPSDQPEPTELHFVMNNPPFPTKSYMTYIGQIAFELMEADSIILRPSAYFSQIQFSLPDSICIDIGHDITHVVAIEDYSIYSPSISKSIAAGSSLDLFTSIDQFDVYKYETYQQIEQARKRKEEKSFVSLNFENDLNNNENYFPFVCGELLFNKKLFETMSPEDKKPDKKTTALMMEPSITNIIKKSIENCHPSKQKILWNNIIVRGGTSLMKGFRERLKRDLREIAPFNAKPRLFFPENPIVDAWQGGKWMANSVENWLNKSDYKEDPAIIFNKCNKY